MKKDPESKVLMGLFFYMYWLSCDKKSMVSGTYLGEEPNRCYMHHILPKSTYPQLKYSFSNILIVSSEEHTKIESGEDIFPELALKRKELLKNMKKYVKEAKDIEKRILKPTLEKYREDDSFRSLFNF